MVDNISSLSSMHLLGGAGKSKDSPAKTKDAAQQFEALMIGQLLKTSRESGSSGWLGTGEDGPGQTGMEMAEQQFAAALAKSGGFGLTKTITQQLERKGP